LRGDRRRKRFSVKLGGRRSGNLFDQFARVRTYVGNRRRAVPLG
jgi:hypothetical protein